MRFIDQTGEEVCDPNFAKEVMERSPANLERCYQCLTCTLGCPVAFAMDWTPNQIIRMVRLGMRHRVLTSSTIWLCASCETCVTRCPNEVDLVRVMDSLREMALRDRTFTEERSIPLFHRAFLSGIKSRGRVHELSLILRHRFMTRAMFKSDMILGLTMLGKGKLKLFPSKMGGLEGVKRIFRR